MNGSINMEMKKNELNVELIITASKLELIHFEFDEKIPRHRMYPSEHKLTVIKIIEQIWRLSFNSHINKILTDGFLLFLNFKTGRYTIYSYRYLFLIQSS